MEIMSKETVIVETKLGPVRGIKKQSDIGYDYFAFQKIPFAKPPIGELRFKDPQVPDQWTQPIDATEEGPALYGSGMIGVINVANNSPTRSSEDGLHINVFTKNLKPSKLLAVMVWIHGGAFKTGSSSTLIYGPDYLLQHEVVFISFNYRLGVFGFLSIDDPTFGVPGNAGLKDQSLALRWAKENAAAFGGDPTNITVFGESAGGASVHYHLISDLSRNLFQKAIVQSGSAHNPWAFRDLSFLKNLPQRLAIKLGWNEDDGLTGAFKVLQSADPTDLIKFQDQILTSDEQQIYSDAFGPIVEPYISEQCFVSENLMVSEKRGWGLNIPIMIGGTSEEGLLFHRKIMSDPTIFANLEESIVPLNLAGRANAKELGSKIRSFYFDGKPPSLLLISRVYDLYSDLMILHGMHHYIQLRVNNLPDAAATYVYRYNYECVPASMLKVMLADANVKGVCHGDDILALFKSALAPEFTVNSSLYKTMTRMVALWTSFAITGNPNNQETKEINWTPVDNNQLPYKCLNISDKLTIIDLPEFKRMKFWDELYSIK